MSNPPTTVNDWGQDELTDRLVENFPAQWSSDAARQPGGVLHSLFKALSVPLDLLTKQVLFTFNGCRIMTATDDALDTIGKDFFGTGLKRAAGETDDLYRQRILIHLLAEKVTVNGISRAIELFTGFKPIIREPWNPAQFPCAFIDVENEYGAFWDVSRTFSPELRFQIFIEAQLPGFPSAGQPIYALDEGLATDVPQCAWYEPQPEWQKSFRELDKLIVATKAAGITAWRKYTVASS